MSRLTAAATTGCKAAAVEISSGGPHGSGTEEGEDESGWRLYAQRRRNRGRAPRGISRFDTAVTYNIDEAGQFGITGTYSKGRDEDTGTRTDIYKLALTGKI